MSGASDSWKRALSDIAAISPFCDALEEEDPPCAECQTAMDNARRAATAPLRTALGIVVAEMYANAVRYNGIEAYWAGRISRVLKDYE